MANSGLVKPKQISYGAMIAMEEPDQYYAPEEIRNGDLVKVEKSGSGVGHKLIGHKQRHTHGQRAKQTDKQPLLPGL